MSASAYDRLGVIGLGLVLEALAIPDDPVARRLAALATFVIGARVVAGLREQANLAKSRLRVTAVLEEESGLPEMAAATAALRKLGRKASDALSVKEPQPKPRPWARPKVERAEVG